MTARWIILPSLLAAFLSPIPARAAAVPIEGKLLVEYYDVAGGYLDPGLCHAYFMENDSSTVTALPWAFTLPELSPDAAMVAYSVLIPSTPYPEAADIWVANLDGSDAVNLTGPADLGGVNCNPTWSPDGRMIAFQHSDPTVGQLRCGSGFQVWLINADGTNLRQWISEPTVATMSASWAPDGYRIACEGPDQSCLIGEVTGANLRTILGVNGRDVEWSRDGAKIAYATLEPETAAGEPGVWERLCLCDPSGSNVQVLVEQFLSDSDLNAHIATYDFQPTNYDWLGTIRWVAGPRRPKWSPLGDRIAFIAALPFDPNGPEFLEQLEVWLYDLGTGQTTRLTYDANWDHWLSWGGPNTFPSSPEVTIGNVHVAFSEVAEPGLTTSVWEDSPPALPTAYVAGSLFYRVATTADVAGPISVSVTYWDADLPGPAQNHLALLRYDDGAEEWINVPVTRDTAKNVISGEPTSLGLMGLAWPLPESHFPDVPSSETDPHWALWEIEAAYEAGIVAGYPDGTYHPEYAVTRAQMAVYIARALVAPSGEAGLADYVPAEPRNFPDAPDTGYGDDGTEPFWAYKHIEYCVENGVVAGYQDGTYHPEYQVNRAQMAVYVARALVSPSGEAGLADYVPADPRNFPDVPPTGYGDDGTEPYWAYAHIEYCVEHAVVQGYLDGYYHPDEVVTRAQMAVYVARAFGLTS